MNQTVYYFIHPMLEPGNDEDLQVAKMVMSFRGVQLLKRVVRIYPSVGVRIQNLYNQNTGK